MDLPTVAGIHWGGAKSTRFLQGLLHEMLSGLFRHPADHLPAGIKNVLLVDASIVRQTGIRQNLFFILN